MVHSHFTQLLSKEKPIWNSWYQGPLVWSVLKWHNGAECVGGVRGQEDIVGRWHHGRPTSIPGHALMSKSWPGETSPQICERLSVLGPAASLCLASLLKIDVCSELDLWIIIHFIVLNLLPIVFIKFTQHYSHIQRLLLKYTIFSLFQFVIFNLYFLQRHQ